MEKRIAEANVGKFVEKRLAPVKVALRLLNHELDLAQGQEVTLDRHELANVVSTLELFVEDFTDSYTRQQVNAVVERKLVEPADKQNTVRVN